MIAIREPRDFAEVFKTLMAMWREEGTVRFARTVLRLGHEPSAAGVMWSIGLIGTLITFAWCMYMEVVEGHAALNMLSDGINWGAQIPTYVFFALTSSGLTMIAALPMVFGFKQFYPIAKRAIWLAIITLIAGFAVLAFELGHPFRMLWAVPTGLQIMSPMFWMGVFYTIDLILLIIKFYLLWQDDWDSPKSHMVGILSFVAVILASGMLGLLFGSVVMRPMWYGSFTSIYFMLTAALSGAAMIVLSTYMAYGFDRDNMPATLKTLAGSDELPKVFATLAGIALVMILTRFWTGMWTNLDGMEGFKKLAASPWFHLEIWVGLALPFIAMMHPATNRKVGWQVASAALVLIAMFINRIEFVISGQLVPLFKGTWVNSLIDYTPSFTEWMSIAMGFFIVLMLYGLGEKLFRLHASPSTGAAGETAKVVTSVPA
ncbi:molybdopterin-containing oxidoreductase family membrane subunit [Sulfuritortus calidifontis]|uniref:Molybdopterin-containing oxidoreductase family membrane subunit n=1 Tax=Sulfuritortus calidifontis TaxID=1914471 RepID=A0A4R3JV43_9PROT|nr:NrfD/PsrC family molybdoenzyme membrane anchor subunit [Sulfuritortus calidifontis]TCS71755.1 molybdopterin-containing oxidoreductase family membrane subunit [Sulfuritortus calidifontis]